MYFITDILFLVWQLCVIPIWLTANAVIILLYHMPSLVFSNNVFSLVFSNEVFRSDDVTAWSSPILFE